MQIQAIEPFASNEESPYSDVQRFFDELPLEQLKRVLEAIDACTSRPTADLFKTGKLGKVASDVLELRCGNHSTNFRLLLCSCCSGRYVVVAAFLKKTQKLQKQDIERSVERCKAHRRGCQP